MQIKIGLQYILVSKGSEAILGAIQIHMYIHCTRIHVMGARTPGSLFIESWGVNYISSSALLLYLNLSNLNLIIMAFYF